jgi:hypothetical protein
MVIVHIRATVGGDASIDGARVAACIIDTTVQIYQEFQGFGLRNLIAHVQFITRTEDLITQSVRKHRP